MQVTVTIPQVTYGKIQQAAGATNRTVEELLVQFAEWATQQQLIVFDEDIDADLEREKAAYLRLHPQLQRDYAEHFVAIHNERLVDSDPIRSELMARIERDYPEQFVWVSQIKSDSIRQIRVPTMRIDSLERK